MDLFTITVAVLGGAAVGAGLVAYADSQIIQRRNKRIAQLMEQSDDLWLTLRALRRNAFITNTKGHRVRYTNATAEERAKAEGQV